MIEDQPQQHDMHLAATHPSGAEEWYCPTCGRRFVMQWPPTYKRIILNGGDEYAAHSGGKGGLSVSATNVQPSDEAAPNDDDLPLQHWEAWFESEDIDSWWPDD